MTDHPMFTAHADQLDAAEKQIDALFDGVVEDGLGVLAPVRNWQQDLAQRVAGEYLAADRRGEPDECTHLNTPQPTFLATWRIGQAWCSACESSMTPMPPGACDKCGRQTSDRFRGFIPVGAAVVQFRICRPCHETEMAGSTAS